MTHRPHRSTYEIRLRARALRKAGACGLVPRPSCVLHGFTSIAFRMLEVARGIVIRLRPSRIDNGPWPKQARADFTHGR